eukprot:749242-Hanusia_phi.AAC.6
MDISEHALGLSGLLLTFALVCIECRAVWAQVDRSKLDFIRKYVENAMNSTPPHSIILVQGDTQMYVTRYLQAVIGIRRDLSIIEPSMLSASWL